MNSQSLYSACPTKHQIVVSNVSKSFNELAVLQNVSLQIPKGSSFVILGGSGNGKSVLIKTIIGLIKPNNGDIYLDDVNLCKISYKERFALMSRFGFMFQGCALFDSMTIEENVTFFLAHRNKLSKTQRRQIALQQLEMVGLSAKELALFPSELSGGMQKRVALARAICHQPEIIFFDEPTAGLDPIMSETINELIQKITQKLKTTAITITHDLCSMFKIATHVAFLNNRTIEWQGRLEELKTAQNTALQNFIKARGWKDG
ncbi:putative ABC transporter ATP-binding protein [Rickettsiales endosymbiont of Paramecium tredecaurelia]|uniref:ABC transporter ATP-binding protein n=1 Tax=Candidatus Sarmatiella mevalonica TaxID=2770581 RepID=UPI0019214A93|nr:ATP-binding cassette domain-containing protein [Candidatus Sarmatiella mevalonica]MBL3284468.1 putative ABC transporter ATP-binding protein [Candidatus Sarmatiella mevalonica]